MERADRSGRTGGRAGQGPGLAALVPSPTVPESERPRIDPDVEAVLLSPLLRENFAQTAQAARQLARQWLKSPAEVPEGGIAALNKVAEVTYLNDDLDGSWKLWERVITLCHRQPRTTVRERAAALQGIGTIQHKRGDLAGAEKRLRHSWSLRCRIAEERTPQAAVALNRLALIRRELGDLDEAEALLRQSLEIRRESLGEADPDLGTSLNNLGALLLARGKTGEAEAFLSQAVDLRRRILGSDHVDYASSLGNLALYHQIVGDLDRAVELQRKALNIRETQLGPHHPLTAANQHLLADLLLKQGEVEAVLPLLDESQGDQSAGPGPSLRRGPDAPPASRNEPGVGDVSSISRMLVMVRDLEREFRGLGGELRAAGDRLREPGRPPDEALPRRLASCRSGFNDARDQVLEYAGRVGPPIVEGERDDLAGLGRYLVRVEAELTARRIRRQARKVLDRVVALTHADDPEFAPLLACRAQASTLRDRLGRVSGPELEDLAYPLIQKVHPLNHLLRLVGGREDLNEESRTAGRAAVAREYGESLADAATLGKLLLRDSGSDWDEVRGRS